MHFAQKQYIFHPHISSMNSNDKMGTDARAAEWALKRHFEGKSNVSPHQLRNISKATNLASKSKKAKKKRSITQVTSEDLEELKKKYRTSKRNSTEV